MLSDMSRCGSPRPPGPNTLAVPSPSPVIQRHAKSVRKAAWGKFIRKTSEQMLGIPGLNKVNIQALIEQYSYSTQQMTQNHQTLIYYYFYHFTY